MKSSTLLTLLAATLAAAPIVASSASVPAPIRHEVHRALQSHSAADVVIVFKQSAAESLDTLQSVEEDSDDPTKRSQMIDAMVSHLQTQNDAIQRQVLDLLEQEAKGDTLNDADAQPLAQQVHRFAVTSNLYVDGASAEFIQRVAQFPNVQEIRAPEVMQFGSQPQMEEAELDDFRPLPTIQWNVNRVAAPTVWQTGFNGQNVLVGHIDSGARATHEALAPSFIGGNYGWFDPEKNTSEPYDNDGHGTHTLGIIVGQNGIGVAPGAKWMACKGCRGGGSCYEKHLMKCFDFMTCPTDPFGNNRDCSKAPHVINNSWGGNNPNSNVYKDVIDVWRKAKIIPVFSTGNQRPECGSVGAPGNLETVIGVGATNMDDGLSKLSIKGPNVRGTIKPDLVAPGDKIYSSWSGDDTRYAIRYGTSTAASHVTGSIALLLSARPNATFDQAKEWLQSSTDTKSLKGDNRNCGNISDAVFPNNVFGYGRVNAFAAIYGPTPTPQPAPSSPNPAVTMTPTPVTPMPPPPVTTPPATPASTTALVPPIPTPTMSSKQRFCVKITSKFWCAVSVVCKWNDAASPPCSWRFQ